MALPSNIRTVYISGPKGDRGERGVQGPEGPGGPNSQLSSTDITLNSSNITLQDAGLSLASLVNLSTAAIRNVIGVEAVTPLGGMFPTKQINNTSAFNISFLHQNGSAVAKDRIITPDGSTFLLLPGKVLTLSYDYVASRWRCIPGNTDLAVSVPPSIGVTSSLGSSFRASKEDHSHKLVVDSFLASDLSLVIGERDGEVRRCAGVGAQGVGAGSFRWHAGDSTTANGGTVLGSGSGRWKRVYEGAVNVRWFGAKGDGVATNDGPAIQAAINTGARRIFFPAGTYKTTQTLEVLHDCVLFGDCSGGFAAPRIVYSGGGYALQVNGDALHLNEGSIQSVTNFGIENMRFEALTGSGIIFGSAIVGRIILDHVDIADCDGRAMDFGGSTYFSTLRKCGIARTTGIEVREACDLFTMEDCSFFMNKDYDLILSTPTYLIKHCDFEVNEGLKPGNAQNKGSILLKGLAVTSGYGTIDDCRFGPEDVGVQVPPHDIVFEYLGGPGSGVIVRGVRIVRPKFFSATEGNLGHKLCPILINTGLGNFSLEGASVANYTLGEIYFKTEDADFTTSSSAIGSNFVDDLYNVPDEIKCIFNQRAQNEGKFITCRSAQPILKYEAVSFEAWEPNVGTRGVKKAHRTITAASDYSNHVTGVALHAVGADKNLCVAQHGCVVYTRTVDPILDPLAAPFDTSSSFVGAPIYMSGSGVISLTPSNPIKKIAKVVKVATAGAFEVDLSEPTLWSALPSFGQWKIGDVARKSAPVIAGAALSQYVITGWLRLTTSNSGGTNNTLNTDWVEIRVLTGT